MKTFLLSCAVLAVATSASLDRIHLQGIVDRVNSSPSSWKAGLNFDPNTSRSKILKLFRRKEQYHNTRSPAVSEPSNDQPEEFDARAAWPNCPTISKISDQGNCAAGWAIATAGVMSDRRCIATEGASTLPLSAQHLLTCDDDECQGCSTCDAYIGIYRLCSGTPTGGDYQSGVGCQPFEVPPCDHGNSESNDQCSSQPPYEVPQCSTVCTNSDYDVSYDDDLYRCENNTDVQYDASYVKYEIQKHGPVIVDIDVFSDFLVYKSGVYKHVEGEHVGETSVRIIGWGVDNGEEYWLIANSLSENWGESGFVRMALDGFPTSNDFPIHYASG